MHFETTGMAYILTACPSVAVRLSCISYKVGRSKPGVVLTGYNCPGQYSRSGQYWSIGGQLKN